MKRFLIVILMFLMATQAFSKWVMLFEYQWNKEYIAANLCENKAKPKLKCEGKCQLAKKMAEEDKETSPSSNIKMKFQEVVCTIHDFSKPSFIYESTSSALSVYYILKKVIPPAFPVFHPPA